MTKPVDLEEPTSIAASKMGLKISSFEGVFDEKDPVFKSDQAAIDFCKSAYSEWQSLGYGDRVLQGGDEFYSTALMGSDGGEVFAPVIKLGLLINQLFVRMVNPINSLVIHGPGAIGQISQYSQNVYTPHNIHAYLAEKYLDTSELDNVNMISYDDIYNKIHNYDYACIIMGATVDRELLTSILDSMNSQGVLILSGASNGGELYTNLEESYAYQVHQEVIERGDFSLYNIPNFMSQTVCIKNG